MELICFGGQHRAILATMDATSTLLFKDVISFLPSGGAVTHNYPLDLELPSCVTDLVRHYVTPLDRGVEQPGSSSGS